MAMKRVATISIFAVSQTRASPRAIWKDRNLICIQFGLILPRCRQLLHASNRSKPMHMHFTMDLIKINKRSDGGVDAFCITPLVRLTLPIASNLHGIPAPHAFVVMQRNDSVYVPSARSASEQSRNVLYGAKKCSTIRHNPKYLPLYESI